MTDRTDISAPGQHVYQRVEIAAPRNVELGSVVNCGVRQSDWRVSGTGPPVRTDLTGDDADQRTAIVGGEQLGIVAFDGLIRRRCELVFLRQVHPQLDPVEDT